MKISIKMLPAALALALATANLSAAMPQDYPGFTYAAESSVEAVVYVEVTIKPNTTRQQLADPFFQFFFGDEYELQRREQKASGSGVIIRPDGYIVTNNHVVADATSIKVTLNNDKIYDATIVGTDPTTDIALIKIEAKGLPYLSFSDSDKLRLGEWVLAIGSPYNLKSTITAGIVSAKGRSMPNYKGDFKIESFIQTDAAVNPGNSGGALVNRKGELVGINTAIISQTGSYSGYSFAVPSNIASKVVGDLIDFGSVRRARLGVVMKPVEEKVAEQMKLSSLEGVYIVEVEKGSAADKAGIKKDDVILEVGGKKVKSAAGLQELVNAFHPGDVTTVEVARGQSTHNLKVVFQGDSAQTGYAQEDGTVSFYGASLKAADKSTLADLRIKNGVEIVSAGKGKLAASGAVDGLIIRYVNDQSVSKPQDVIDAAARAKRAIVIECITPAGRSVFFALAKE